MKVEGGGGGYTVAMLLGQHAIFLGTYHAANGNTLEHITYHVFHVFLGARGGARNGGSNCDGLPSRLLPPLGGAGEVEMTGPCYFKPFIFFVLLLLFFFFLFFFFIFV